MILGSWRPAAMSSSPATSCGTRCARVGAHAAPARSVAARIRLPSAGRDRVGEPGVHRAFVRERQGVEPAEDRRRVRRSRPPDGLGDVDPGVDADRRPPVHGVDLGHDACLDPIGSGGASGCRPQARPPGTRRRRAAPASDVGREDLLDRPGAGQRLEAPDPAEFATGGGDRRAQRPAEAEHSRRWRPRRAAAAAGARDGHRRSVRRRLGADGRDQFLRRVVGLGFWAAT